MGGTQTTAKNKKFVEVEKIIASKSETLARWMPGFALRFLKRLLHEDEVNDIMSRIGHMQGLDFVEGTLNELNTTIKTIGTENIPKERGVILAANHPLGGLDGMAFMKAVGEVRQDIQFLVNDMLLNIKNLESLFVPVNKVGQNPRESTKRIEEAYSKEIAVLIFPAGLVSRKQPEGIKDLDWKRSFILKARRYEKDIIPVHIDGKNSKRFYRFSQLRRKLGIKGNLEMGLLSDEMFRQRNETITIRFGKPVPYQSLDKSKSPTEWAAVLRDKTYSLPNEM